MPANKGQFQKGAHWRPKNPLWERAWLETEYVTKQRSTGDIAKEIGVTDGAVLHWLRKHGIARRDTAQARKAKKWGSPGASNPMHGKRGILNPQWRGGLTPLRQKIYASAEWSALEREVKKRDKCCRLCTGTVKLQIHHIDPFSQAPLLMLDIGNVIRLCKTCHEQMKGKEQRWKKKLFKLLTNGKEK